MRVAILTLPLHTNYGGILQAYALQTVLERMGHDVEVLQKRPGRYPCHPILMPVVYAKRLLRKLFSDKNITIFAEQENARLRQHTDHFINSYIKRRFIRTIVDVLPSDYDAIIVGSDQIWRRNYYSKTYQSVMFSTKVEDAFLDFAKKWDIVRIAYAASFGLDKWEYSETETQYCCYLLKKFVGISVREKSGVELCQEYFRQNVKHVLDPTMLLNKEDYLELAGQYNTGGVDGDMFCYILDGNVNKQNVINALIQIKGYTPFYMCGDIGNSLIDNMLPQPHVGSWIKALYDASIIVTDSFHACVFSIIFNKPFIVLGNYERGLARLESLLGIFGLQDRLICDYHNEIPDINGINWRNVNVKLKMLREQSYNFLNENLNG